MLIEKFLTFPGKNRFCKVKEQTRRISGEMTITYKVLVTLPGNPQNARCWWVPLNNFFLLVLPQRVILVLFLYAVF